MSGKKNAPIQESSPPITSLRDWIGFQIKQHWSVMSKAPFGVLSVAMLIAALAIYGTWFVTWRIAIPLKDIQIEQLKTANDILSGSASPFALSQSVVRKQAQILSGQLSDFAKTFKRGYEPYFQMDYHNRFSLRVLAMRNAFDTLGQDSPTLDRAIGFTEMNGIATGDVDSNYVAAVAAELQTLASNLK